MDVGSITEPRRHPKPLDDDESDKGSFLPHSSPVRQAKYPTFAPSSLMNTTMLHLFPVGSGRRLETRLIGFDFAKILKKQNY